MINLEVFDCVTHSNPSFSKGAKDAAEHRFPDGTVDWYMSSDFNIDYDSVELLDLVAKGSYGTVYKAVWQGDIVAAKLEDFKDGDEEQVNLLVELTMLQCFPHERCVRFLGAGCISHDYGTHVERKLMIVMELCERGALRECLRERLPWNLHVRICLDIATGIAFLHDNQIIHRDIKSTNVLIDSSWRAKLCDFSFACHNESTTKTEVTYGTDEFMSPEIAVAQDFNMSSDIFSYGIVLCEIITGREPSDTFMKRLPRNYFALNEAEVRAAVQMDCPEALESLALNCCDVDPTKRPSAHLCVQELTNILTSLGGPDFEYTPTLPREGSGALKSSPSPFREGKVRNSMDGTARHTRSPTVNRRIWAADVQTQAQTYMQLQLETKSSVRTPIEASHSPHQSKDTKDNSVGKIDKHSAKLTEKHWTTLVKELERQVNELRLQNVELQFMASVSKSAVQPCATALAQECTSTAVSANTVYSLTTPTLTDQLVSEAIAGAMSDLKSHESDRVNIKDMSKSSTKTSTANKMFTPERPGCNLSSSTLTSQSASQITGDDTNVIRSHLSILQHNVNEVYHASPSDKENVTPTYDSREVIEANNILQDPDMLNRELKQIYILRSKIDQLASKLEKRLFELGKLPQTMSSSSNANNKIRNSPISRHPSSRRDRDQFSSSPRIPSPQLFSSISASQLILVDLPEPVTVRSLLRPVNRDLYSSKHIIPSSPSSKQTRTSSEPFPTKSTPATATSPIAPEVAALLSKMHTYSLHLPLANTNLNDSINDSIGTVSSVKWYSDTYSSLSSGQAYSPTTRTPARSTVSTPRSARFTWRDIDSEGSEDATQHYSLPSVGDPCNKSNAMSDSMKCRNFGDSTGAIDLDITEQIYIATRGRDDEISGLSISTGQFHIPL